MASSLNSFDDAFPTIFPQRDSEFPPLPDDLTPLEKIYLFSRSHIPFLRVHIAHALPAYLNDGHVSPADAVHYVFPLLNVLALDDGLYLLRSPCLGHVNSVKLQMTP